MNICEAIFLHFAPQHIVERAQNTNVCTATQCFASLDDMDMALVAPTTAQMLLDVWHAVAMMMMVALLLLHAQRRTLSYDATQKARALTRHRDTTL